LQIFVLLSQSAHLLQMMIVNLRALLNVLLELIVLHHQIVILLPQLLYLLHLHLALVLVELALLFDALQVLVERLDDTLILVQLLLVIQFFLFEVVDHYCFFCCLLMHLLLKFGDYLCLQVSLSSCLQYENLVPLYLVLEISNIGDVINLIDHVHQVEHLVHVLLRILSKGCKPLLVGKCIAVFVLHIDLNEVIIVLLAFDKVFRPLGRYG